MAHVDKEIVHQPDRRRRHRQCRKSTPASMPRRIMPRMHEQIDYTRVKMRGSEGGTDEEKEERGREERGKTLFEIVWGRVWEWVEDSSTARQHNQEKWKSPDRRGQGKKSEGKAGARGQGI